MVITLGDTMIEISSGIRDIYSPQGLIPYTLFAEACTAFEILKELNGGADQYFETFIDGYCLQPEKRHYYRTFIGSIKDGEDYKKLIFKLSNLRDLMRSKNKKDRFSAASQFRSTIQELAVAGL